MRRRLHLLVIPVAAALAVLPLLLNGCSCGHDLSFHLLSWLDAARQIYTVELHPRWAFSPAYGAGEPRFVFYPPLSWTVGAALTLLLRHLPHLTPEGAFAYVPILYIWITLCSAGLAAHLLLRRYTSAGAALIASTLYLTNPYTLFTAYERSAFAELLAATWIPLLLLAILPVSSIRSAASSDSAEPVPIPLLALAVAFLWLTNAPAAVMSCYALALLTALRLVNNYRQTPSLRDLLEPVGRVVAGTSLGLALSAFYLLPAAYERRWVQISMAIIPGMRIADNTLFHHTGDTGRDAVVHLSSLLAVGLLSATAVALLFAWIMRTRPGTVRLPPKHLIPLLSILTAVIAFLLTPLSAPVWRYAPEMAFLQFPWRILAIAAVTLALAVALALRPLPLRMPAALAVSLLLPAAFTYGAYRSFRQICASEDTPAAQFALFQSSAGTDPTDEYTPVNADNDSLQPAGPAFCLMPAVQDAKPPCAADAPHGPAPMHLDLNLVSPRSLVLNLRDYPAWQVNRNHVAIPERIEREDGLIAVPLPSGHSSIDVRYTSTPDELAGDAISAVALCVFAPLAALSLRRRLRTSPSGARHMR